MWFRLIFAVVFGAALFADPNTVFSHGTGYRVSKIRPISLEFFYSTGEKMSYMEAKVYSPNDEKFAYQSGRTDEDGRFAFTPNAVGEWRIHVKDEKGHSALAKIKILPEHVISQDVKSNDVPSVTISPSMPDGDDLYVRVALGVSLLFNAAAVTIVVRRRKKA